MGLTCCLQGRHVGQSISRAAKAEDGEKQLPATLAALRSLLQDWAVDHGSAFLLNGTNYLVRLVKNGGGYVRQGGTC